MAARFKSARKALANALTTPPSSAGLGVMS
jgi:hypothetical protein